MRLGLTEGVGLRGALLIAMGMAGLLGGYGCATDCDISCGKLEFCQQLPGVSRNLCIDRCKERKSENGKQTQICAECLDNASCKSISRGTCFRECEPVVGDRVDGEGGAGGDDGVGRGGAGAGGDLGAAASLGI